MTTIAMTTIDCAEVAPEVEFWSTLLGWEVAMSSDDYGMLSGPHGQRLGFGRVEGYRRPAWPDPHGGKQFHLDLACDDIEAECTRAVDLGAQVVDPQPGETWRVLLDPAGHPFCLTSAANW